MRFLAVRSKLMKDAPENVVFEGALGRILAVAVKGNVVVGLMEKLQYLAC